MPDPTERLSRIGDLPAGSPLPPEEVRRLGDRMRRRRLAGSALAASAAVAVIASGAVAVTQQGGGGTPPIAGPSASASPDVSGLTRIPEDFPLGLRLPEPGGDVPQGQESQELDTPWRGLPCPTDERTFSTVLDTDRQRTDARSIEVDAPEEYAARVLAVYPDAATAEMAVAEIRAAAEGCGPTEAVPGLTEMRWSVEEVEYGDSPGLVLWGAEHSVEAGEPTGVGRSVNLLVRVSNALLLTTLSDESGAAPLDLDEPRVAALWSATADLADQMCVFAPDPCS